MSPLQGAARDPRVSRSSDSSISSLLHGAASVERADDYLDHIFSSSLDEAMPVGRTYKARSTVSSSMQGAEFVNRVNRISYISTSLSLLKLMSDDGVNQGLTIMRHHCSMEWLLSSTFVGRHR